jgi:hypothetical protein
LGSFRFIPKAASALIPLGWYGQLGSFGISRLGSKGGLDSGVAMADCAPFRRRLKPESQELIKHNRRTRKNSVSIRAIYYWVRRERRLVLEETDGWQARATRTCFKGSRHLEQAISGK